MRKYAIAFLASLLSGCSSFTPPLEHPVIKEKLGRSFIDDSGAVGTLSLTPERRVVLVKFSERYKDGTLVSRNRFCAEAPTEVGVDIARLTKVAATLERPEQAKAGLEAITGATIGNIVLNKRTQGVQLFQSSSYFLCQMYMNDAINEKQLMLLQLETLKMAGQLISQEIPMLYQKSAEIERSMTFNQLDVANILNQLLKLETQKKQDEKDEAPKP